MPPRIGSQRLRERMRDSFNTNLPDTAAIYRPGAATPTDDFGSNSTYSLIGVVEANYWTITGQEALILQRMDVKASDTVVLPAGTDINELDEIVYTESETGVIHHFIMNVVYSRSRPTTLRVGCVEYKFDTQHNE